MALSGSTLAVLLGVGLLQAGCAGAPDEPAGGVETVARARAALNGNDSDPMGTTGTNGLRPSVVQAQMSQIQGALFTNLVMPDKSMNPLMLAYFNAPTGFNTLPYLLKCGLPAGISVPFDGEVLQGMLTTTGAWLKGPLSDVQAKSDFFGCLAAHLNASGQHVKIRLTGEAVRNEPGNVEENPAIFQEALWLSDDAPAGFPHFDVWPLPDLTGLCGEKITSELLKERVCINGSASCGLTLRHDLGACVDDDKDLKCDGKRVIKSWLPADSIPQMYGRCLRRPTQ